MTGTGKRGLVAALALGCGLLRLVPDTPVVERKVEVPFASPRRVDLVSLRGAWLRAAELASAAYFGGLKSPPDPTPLESCLLRRESYNVEVWALREPVDGGGGDEAGADAGSSETEQPDAGLPDAGWSFETPIPRLLFVTISLHWDACDLGESPPTDLGGNYAIDTTIWRIVGWRQ